MAEKQSTGRIAYDGTSTTFDCRRFEIRTQQMVRQHACDLLSPLKEQEFRFYRYRPGEKVLVLEINEFPETLSEVLPGS
jgi:hypothetical protein